MYLNDMLCCLKEYQQHKIPTFKGKIPKNRANSFSTDQSNRNLLC